MHRIDVSQFNILPDATTLQTAQVQFMIDTLAKTSGGVLVFPRGEFVLGTVFLRDNIYIELNDTTILGSLNFLDYARDEQVDYPLYQDASHSFFDCSLFVAKGCNNIRIYGKGTIDMRSVWDKDNIRQMAHRGAKCVALKECRDVVIDGISIVNATDLAVYFAGCENVVVSNVKVSTYIDGISPDGSKNVKITGCDVLSGDDGIVFKSSYTLNRLSTCRDIEVSNCKISSRCNAIKFGTETNGDFEDIFIHDIDIKNTRLSGIALESVDGSNINNIRFANIKMVNVATPFFVHIGKRMRAPKGMKIGSIQDVVFENIIVQGPYVPYKTIAWNYASFLNDDDYQEPWDIGIAEGLDTSVQYSEQMPWQITSNVCGLEGRPIKDITFKDISMTLHGGAKSCVTQVPKEPLTYPEAFVYGRELPASAIYFRYIDGLKLDNIKIKLINEDVRPHFVLDSVTTK